MNCHCYLLADSSLERKLPALSTPGHRTMVTLQRCHKQKRAVWIIQPCVLWLTKVNYLFTQEFLSSYTTIIMSVHLDRGRRIQPIRGMCPHFSFRIVAPSASRCLRKERWAGRSRQAGSVALAVWEEAAGEWHHSAEQEKQAHLDISGQQEGVHIHRSKRYSGYSGYRRLGGLSRRVCC